MKAAFKISGRIAFRDVDVALTSLVSRLNAAPFLERSFTVTLPFLDSGDALIIPLWTPAWDGFVVRRGFLLTGVDTTRSPRNRYTLVTAHVRSGPRSAEQMGNGWDSRRNGLSVGSVFPLFGESPVDVKVVAGRQIEIQATQSGVPTLDASQIRCQIDVAWEGSA